MSAREEVHERPRSRAGTFLRFRPRPELVLPASETPRRAVASSFGRRDYLLRRLLAVADVTSVLLALSFMVLAFERVDWAHLLWGLLTVPVWVVLLAAYGLYNRDIKRISHSTVDDLPWLLHVVLVGCLLDWLFFNALPTAKLEFLDILLLGTLTLAGMVVLRSIARSISVRMLGAERVLFIGEGTGTDLLIGKMASHPELGLEPIGVVAANNGELDFYDVLRRYWPERVVLCDTRLEETALLELAHRCKELSLKLSVLPEQFSVMGPSVEVDDVEGVTVLGINPPVLPRSARWMKRSLDVSASVFVLIVTAPLMALIALTIRLESGGPVLFKQCRVGKASRRFQLVKFRTMVVDAEDQTEQLLSESQHAGWLKLDHDPRITRVGRLLRLTSLDELPQFWNILTGEMSLVGPRPLIESEDSQIGGWARSRLELTPGLTGLWQVLGRTNIPFEEMVKLDYLYVTNWSLWTDVRLILRTFPAVFARRGAN